MPRVKNKIPKRTVGPVISNSPCEDFKPKKSKRFKSKQENSLQIQFSTSEYPHRLGCIVLTLDDVYINAASDVVLTFTPDIDLFCFLNWKDCDEKGKIQDKSCYAACSTPYEILHSLSMIKIFHFVINSCILSPGDVVVQVYINPSTFVSLNCASEPYLNRHRNKLYQILQYFLSIDFKEYEDNYLHEEEQVQKIYKSICNSYDPEFSNASISHDYLIPSLRVYQKQAVLWMLKQEKESLMDANETDLHVLYTSLVLQDGSNTIFHKYGGYFVNQKFAPERPCKGGILADEMGLGKTLEVLACILLNPRNDIEMQNGEVSNSTKNEDDTFMGTGSSSETEFYSSDDSTEFSTKKLYQKKVSNGLQKDKNSSYKCVCGFQSVSRRSKPLVKCEKCGVLQHAECVLYEHNVSYDEYICPHCWISSPDLLSSRATLIVSPSAIIYQWEQEISRHVKKNCLKVFMYHGVENQKFVDPKFLANHDIVLTSYETFRKELNYANIPSGDSGLTLRHPKKFMNLPSPLSAVQWWRICLDEAQMVESITSKVTQMTLKLQSINRWCITGTPIQKSVEDLYGLLLFLGYSPYQEKLWWKEVLWKPFMNGNSEYITHVLKQIAWRTTKKQVWDQIGLPGLEEAIHKVDFSPIERLFYEKQQANCKNDFIDKVEKLSCLDVKLNSLDKHSLSKILLPLRKLQQVCCHFQIACGNFFDVQKNKMTKEELLAHLLKTAKYECEDIHRKLIMALSGLAGIYAVKNEFEPAIETYEKVLKSIEDNKPTFRTDVTQKIHAMYNLSKLLSNTTLKNGQEIKKSNFNPIELTQKVEELSREYIEKHKAAVEMHRKSVSEIKNEISKIFSDFKLARSDFPTSPWWCELFQNLDDNHVKLFFQKLEDILKTAPGKTLLRAESSIIESLDKAAFMATVYEKSQDLYETRLKLRCKIESIAVEPSSDFVESAISCHLRPTGDKKSKCIYCEAGDIFNLYEAKLFRFDESGNTESHTEEEEVKVICFQAQRRGTHADSDLEISLKWLLNYCRRRQDLLEYVEDGVNELKLIDALKKEFKSLRALWLRCNEYVSQKDEIEMAKITSRILLPGENPPKPPIPYILAPHEVQPKLVQYLSDRISFQFELKKKMGQLFYLQNLEKAGNKDDPFDECCPVCRQKFGTSWSVLQCGHNFCLLCIQRLLTRTVKFTNTLGFTCEGIPCPICREYTACSDIYCIENDNKKDDQVDLPIKGSYSAKATAIVRCLLQISKTDPGAKSLVFSSFTDFLHIVERALLENDIKCLNLCNKKYFKDRLNNFKQSEDENILLIPLAFGCNGLNITEATHVLLLEPVLDYSKHLQAIGRVHRIGQTKMATVHRFIVSQSIDENLYNINKNFSSSDVHDQTVLTLRDLKHLFE